MWVTGVGDVGVLCVCVCERERERERERVKEAVVGTKRNMERQRDRGGGRDGRTGRATEPQSERQGFHYLNPQKLHGTDCNSLTLHPLYSYPSPVTTSAMLFGTLQSLVCRQCWCQLLYNLLCFYSVKKQAGVSHHQSEITGVA